MAEQANTSGISCETETPRRRHKEGGYHCSHRDQPGACWSCPRPKWNCPRPKCSAPRRLCGSGPVGGRGMGRTLPALLVSIGQSGRSGRGERAELGVYWPGPGSSVRAGRVRGRRQQRPGKLPGQRRPTVLPALVLRASPEPMSQRGRGV